ncbi:MAG: PEP-CTERM sorting domain-containing protein [Rhodospirillaceae bacterium]
MFRKILSATILSVSLSFSFLAAPAKAVPILGSQVEGNLFLDALDVSHMLGWAYLGPDLGPPSPFAAEGTLKLVHRSSTYQNTFGTSDINHENRVEIFGATAAVGATHALSMSPFERLFYFGADGADLLLASDDNRQYTDGFSSGGTPGSLQGGMEIFYHADSHKWAFFFDDAGGGLPILGDDNDYDDLVVTFQLPNRGVPEPGAIGLLGFALLGLAGLMRRRKPA